MRKQQTRFRTPAVGMQLDVGSTRALACSDRRLAGQAVGAFPSINSDLGNWLGLTGRWADHGLRDSLLGVHQLNRSYVPFAAEIAANTLVVCLLVAAIMLAPLRLLGQPASAITPSSRDTVLLDSPTVLSGPKAVEHLKATGQYDSQAAAITTARYAVKPVEDGSRSQNPVGAEVTRLRSPESQSLLQPSRWDAQHGAPALPLAHPMGEGARRAGEGSFASPPADSSVTSSPTILKAARAQNAAHGLNITFTPEGVTFTVRSPAPDGFLTTKEPKDTKRTELQPENRVERATSPSSAACLPNRQATRRREPRDAQDKEVNRRWTQMNTDEKSGENSLHPWPSAESVVGLPSPESTHTVGWRLRSLGYGATQVPVPAGTLRKAGQRVELTRTTPAVTEWFVNAPAGLEHGFTLPERPKPSSMGAPQDKEGNRRWTQMNTDENAGKNSLYPCPSVESVVGVPSQDVEPLRLVLEVTGDLTPHLEGGERTRLACSLRRPAADSHGGNSNRPIGEGSAPGSGVVAGGPAHEPGRSRGHETQFSKAEGSRLKAEGKGQETECGSEESQIANRKSKIECALPNSDVASQSLALRDAAGRTVLTYAKLRVWDVTGAKLSPRTARRPRQRNNRRWTQMNTDEKPGKLSI